MTVTEPPESCNILPKVVKQQEAFAVYFAECCVLLEVVVIVQLSLSDMPGGLAVHTREYKHVLLYHCYMEFSCHVLHDKTDNKAF